VPDPPPPPPPPAPPGGGGPPPPPPPPGGPPPPPRPPPRGPARPRPPPPATPSGAAGSSSTYAVSGYLASGCPDVWKAGQGSTVQWAAVETLEGRQGSGQMEEALESTPWGLGYLDTGHGADAELREVELRNRSGSFVSSASADMAQLSEALAPSFPGVADGALDATGDWSRVTAVDLEGAASWPLCLLSFVYVDREPKTDFLAKWDDASGHLLRAFLDFLLSDAGQKLAADEYSFSPLSGPALAHAREAVSQVNWGALPEPGDRWSFEVKTLEYGDGAGDQVLSAKRVDYTSLALDDVTEDLAALLARAAALEARAGDLERRLAVAERNAGAGVGLAVVLLLVGAGLAGLALLKRCRGGKPKFSTGTYGAGAGPGAVSVQMATPGPSSYGHTAHAAPSGPPEDRAAPAFGSPGPPAPPAAPLPAAPPPGPRHVTFGGVPPPARGGDSGGPQLRPVDAASVRVEGV